MAARVSEDVVRLAIGLISVGFVAMTLARERRVVAEPRSGEGRAGPVLGDRVGILASFVSHSGGPPFLVYAMPQRLTAPAFAGTSALFFAAVNLMKLPPYLMLGQFTRENLTASLALLPLATASTIAGVYIVRRVSTARFYKFVLVITFALGVKLVYDAARGLWG